LSLPASQAGFKLKRIFGTSLIWKSLK
jgi:hypothetical protein